MSSVRIIAGDHPLEGSISCDSVPCVGDTIVWGIHGTKPVRLQVDAVEWHHRPDGYGGWLDAVLQCSVVHEGDDT